MNKDQVKISAGKKETYVNKNEIKINNQIYFLKYLA